MKKISPDDLIKVTIIKPEDLTSEEWEAYIFLDTPLIQAEDASNDDWELLPEYAQSYYYIMSYDGELKYGEELRLVHYSHIMYRCWRESALYSGWGYHNPEAESGTDDCGGEPDYCFEDSGKTVYLTGSGYVTQEE